MASNDIVANDEDTYNKEYRRLRTLTSQTDILEQSVSFCHFPSENSVIFVILSNKWCGISSISSLKIYNIYSRVNRV